jgi:hypothetical protein
VLLEVKQEKTSDGDVDGGTKKEDDATSTAPTLVPADKIVADSSISAAAAAALAAAAVKAKVSGLH